MLTHTHIYIYIISMSNIDMIYHSICTYSSLEDVRKLTNVMIADKYDDISVVTIPPSVLWELREEKNARLHRGHGVPAHSSPVAVPDPPAVGKEKDYLCLKNHVFMFLYVF